MRPPSLGSFFLASFLLAAAGLRAPEDLHAKEIVLGARERRSPRALVDKVGTFEPGDVVVVGGRRIVLGERVGEGTAAVVFRLEGPYRPPRVIKFPNEPEMGRSLLRQEIRALDELKRRGFLVSSIHDAETGIFVTKDYVAGATLDGLERELGRLTDEQVRTRFSALGRLMERLAEQNVFFNDIGHGNLIYSEERGDWVIIDPGAVKSRRELPDILPFIEDSPRLAAIRQGGRTGEATVAGMESRLEGALARLWATWREKPGDFSLHLRVERLARQGWARSAASAAAAELLEIPDGALLRAPPSALVAWVEGVVREQTAPLRDDRLRARIRARLDGLLNAEASLDDQVRRAARNYLLATAVSAEDFLTRYAAYGKPWLERALVEEGLLSHPGARAEALMESDPRSRFLECVASALSNAVR